LDAFYDQFLSCILHHDLAVNFAFSAGDRILLVEENLLDDLLEQDLGQSGVSGILVSLKEPPQGGRGSESWSWATRNLWREFPLPIQVASEDDGKRLAEKAEKNEIMVGISSQTNLHSISDSG
jgi:hypothetical protein